MLGYDLSIHEIAPFDVLFPFATKKRGKERKMKIRKKKKKQKERKKKMNKRHIQFISFYL